MELEDNSLETKLFGEYLIEQSHLGQFCFWFTVYICVHSYQSCTLIISQELCPVFVSCAHMCLHNRMENAHAAVVSSPNAQKQALEYS